MMDRQSWRFTLVWISALFLAMLMMTTMIQALDNFNDNDESWNLERHYRHAHYRDDMATSSMVHGRDVRNIMWSGITSCHVDVPVKTPDDSTDDLLPQSSTCPWYWIINYDPHRIPSTLLMAQCSCRNCLSAGTTGHRCQPVHYFRKVYYKGADGTIPKLYRVAVGCTCERHGSD